MVSKAASLLSVAFAKSGTKKSFPVGTDVKQVHEDRVLAVLVIASESNTVTIFVVSAMLFDKPLCLFLGPSDTHFRLSIPQ